MKALSNELQGSTSEVDLRVAAPEGVDLASFCANDLAESSTQGFRSNLGVQLGLPIRYPEATILSFCNVPPLLARRAIVWIHDANTLDVPDSYPAGYRAWHRCILEVTRLRRFPVVTVSEYAKRRLVHHGLRSAQVQVIYNGGDHILRYEEDHQVYADSGLSQGEFILVVGSPAKHKNLHFAIRALLPLCEKGLRLAVVGLAQTGQYNDDELHVLDPRVVLLPRLSDGGLRALYRGAKAVVSPSLCEGFGLYVAEAMFAGSGPLVLSDRTALPEVAGEAALYFDPSDAASCRAAVIRAMEPDVATQVREAARERRELFRWSRAARQLLEQYMV